MRLIITGGGTGGHTSPAVAVYEELLRRDPRLNVLWIGRDGAIEQRICTKLNIPFRSLPVEGWPRAKFVRRGWVVTKLAWSMARVWFYLRNFQPDVVFGVGGYVSLPAMYVAPRMGIPSVLHEQNRLMGMTNRMAAQRAARIFLSFPETIGDFPKAKAAYVGNPVRAAFANPPSRDNARARFNLDPARPAVLITGGSQGARSINDTVGKMVSLFSPNELQIIWMTGQNDVVRARDAVKDSPVSVQVHSFIEDMAAAFAAVDLVVARSGASTTAELALMHKPSILIPYPHATDNHQEHNAKAFVESGASVLLRDGDMSPEKLIGSLRELLRDHARLESMQRAAGTLAKPGAADSIAAEILSLAFD
ncbi:MAG: undecaprenyldiphospho-muramoylpentapeptide beta-N-acetylglucosaminyltransferase [Candidatus Hydrogenedentes bacterium]|nr:undecaprenyldiphospho-muramoylpentapeptide beta-N-acetylglucosaminyltransferase [Candidatus Hydrogenedentota bacterium]